MCTLLFAWHVFGDVPLAVAANRDEALDRPSKPPTVIEGPPRYLAPRDVVAGGTWIGYTASGRFVAITNRSADLDGERSRGLLVHDCLTAPDTQAARRGVEIELETRLYAGFNLIVLDQSTGWVVEWDGTARWTDLEPGVHVVTNGGLSGIEPAATAIADRIQPERSQASEWLDRAMETLVDHDLDTCVHRNGYGTRSSSIVTVDAQGYVRYRFASGPPCRTRYRTVFDGLL